MTEFTITQKYITEEFEINEKFKNIKNIAKVNFEMHMKAIEADHARQIHYMNLSRAVDLENCRNRIYASSNKPEYYVDIEVANEETENIEEVANEETENIEEVANEETENIEEVANEETENIEEVANEETENNEEVANEETENNEEVANEETENNEEVANEETENNEEVANEETENIEEVSNEETENIEEVANEETENIKASPKVSKIFTNFHPSISLDSPHSSLWSDDVEGLEMNEFEFDNVNSDEVIIDKVIIDFGNSKKFINANKFFNIKNYVNDSPDYQILQYSSTNPIMDPLFEFDHNGQIYYVEEQGMLISIENNNFKICPNLRWK
jgi:DNA polymerase III gamma/tau subunit